MLKVHTILIKPESFILGNTEENNLTGNFFGFLTKI